MVRMEYRVDFRSKNPDQKRFHKAFTFTWAETSEEAVARIVAVRPGEKVEILSVMPVR